MGGERVGVERQLELGSAEHKQLGPGVLDQARLQTGQTTVYWNLAANSWITSTCEIKSAIITVISSICISVK